MTDAVELEPDAADELLLDADDPAQVVAGIREGRVAVTIAAPDDLTPEELARALEAVKKEARHAWALSNRAFVESMGSRR